MKKFSLIRFLVFIASTVSLAAFFEAGRKMAQSFSFVPLLSSIVSFIIVVLSILALGYWIYAEEKEKNNLRIQFGLYEWIYEQLVIARSETTKQSSNVMRLLRHLVSRNDVERIQK